MQQTVLRGKFIAIQSYLRKQGKSQINNLTLKQLQKGRQTKPSQQKERNQRKEKKQMKERQRKQWKRSMKVKAGSLKK